MKIAYLFLLYEDVNHPQLWERYFNGHEETTKICCHAARRENAQTPFVRDNLIPFWVSTQWGNIGLVAAHLELIRNALRDPDVSRLVLCSGSCVPIKTYEQTYAALFEQEKSWVAVHRRFLSRMSKVTTLPADHHRKNSQWVALTRQHAELLVRFNFLADFIRCVIPDEHYVGSVLTHLGEEDNMRQLEQTYAHWEQISSVQMSPTVFGKLEDETINKLSKVPCLFARKFSPISDIDERWDEIVGG